MATYAELYGLFQNADLRNRITVACIIAADTIRAEATNTANHTNRLLWAKAVLSSPEMEGSRMLMDVLASNKALTVSQLTGATDAAIQTAVNASVDLFATGS